MRTVARGMELVALVAAAVFVVLLFANEPSEPAAQAVGGAAEAEGAAVYSTRCSACHGADGGGGRGPALGGGAVVEAFPDAADQIAVVTSGRGGMPSFGDDLSAEEIEAVVAYTRTGLGAGQ
jgi:mono/diheme cytochrome c family protein